MNSKARRVRSLTVGLLALGLVLPPGAGAGADNVVLRGCLLTGNVFDRNASEVEGSFLPAGYTLGAGSVPGAAAITVWVFDCDTHRLDADVPSDRVGIAMIGIRVQQRPSHVGPDRLPPYAIGALTGEPGRHLSPHLLYPDAMNLADFYVLKFLTNDAGVLAYLQEAGFPATLAPVAQRTTEDRPLLDWSPRVADAGEDDDAFSSEVVPFLPDSVHFHDNVLYHGDPGSASQLVVTIPHANDTFCFVVAGCGTVSALPGSWLSDFLGADVRDDPALSFDHELLDRVVISRAS